MSDHKSPFSTRFDNSILVMAMTDEMARADHWKGLDECMAIKPKVVKTYTKYAEAAIRALKRLEGNQTPAPPLITMN